MKNVISNTNRNLVFALDTVAEMPASLVKAVQCNINNNS